LTARSDIATTTLQNWIDAKERADTLDYGLRSIKACGTEHACTGAHGAQLVRAKYEASRILRGTEDQWHAMDAHWIREALRRAREELKSAAAAKKSIGGIRQLRLAIAAECDCHGCGNVRLAGGGEYYCAACIAEQQAAYGDELSAYEAYHEWADKHLIIQTIGAADMNRVKAAQAETTRRSRHRGGVASKRVRERDVPAADSPGSGRASANALRNARSMTRSEARDTAPGYGCRGRITWPNGGQRTGSAPRAPATSSQRSTD
jgi:hypothetical protein